MRGLTGAGSGTRASQRAAITATAGFAALACVLSACGAGGTGARDEGPAHAESVAGTAASPAPSPSDDSFRRVNAVRLLTRDPKVSPAVKRVLKPCAGHEYPIDVTYGHLTGASAVDVVVNVLTCSDAVGVGSYVYREKNGSYENVFKAEESPVYAEIDRGDLTVTKQVYEKGDPVSSPSGENVITYSWSSGRFAEESSHHTDYGNAAGGSAAPSPAG
ncbi:hypothetical protein [Streptomyces sp. V3I7]|uniref:hypothetical protein n=1 Tax=Streptomyces sp. V3I7 TaxID=3042278 RepID=UPI00277F6E1C|nr:hypothetical protein [Streptomyces sp. V3I7]MDQ0992284.1 hypothetical protein [Streptomyces sp. V3I7]